MELSTEEVENYIDRADGRTVLRLPLFEGENIVIERTLGFVQSLEESGADIEIIVFSKNSFLHEKIEADYGAKAKACAHVVDGLHLDYLPYTDVIVSVAKTSASGDAIRKLCVRYGILDVEKVVVKS